MPNKIFTMQQNPITMEGAWVLSKYLMYNTTTANNRPNYKTGGQFTQSPTYPGFLSYLEMLEAAEGGIQESSNGQGKVLSCCTALISQRPGSYGREAWHIHTWFSKINLERWQTSKGTRPLGSSPSGTLVQSLLNISKGLSWQEILQYKLFLMSKFLPFCGWQKEWDC